VQSTRHSGEFVEVGVAAHILDDDVVIGISNGLGFVRLNVAFERECIVKSEGESHGVSEDKEEREGEYDGWWLRPVES
jgi:hypothetical protein